MKPETGTIEIKLDGKEPVVIRVDQLLGMRISSRQSFSDPSVRDRHEMVIAWVEK